MDLPWPPAAFKQPLQQVKIDRAQRTGILCAALPTGQERTLEVHACDQALSRPGWRRH